MVLSAKAVALLVYLAAERVPQHRERLADLLWSTPEARTNLRVELARIRAAGLDIFPPSRQMLSLEQVETDLERWISPPERMDQTELASWLAALRGLPLSGLEDLGSSAFQMWAEQQRWVYCERVEAMLAQVYTRYAAAGQSWATRLIAARAETLGFVGVAEMELGALPAAPLRGRRASDQRAPGALASAPALPEPASEPAAFAHPAPPHLMAGWEPGQLDFERAAEERVLAQVCERALSQPQLLMLSGPPGIGKSYLAERLLERVGWDALRLTAGASGRLLLAALAQGLLRCADTEGTRTLWEVLLQPAALEEDMVKVAVTLARLGQPLVLLIEDAHAAGAELAALFQMILQMSGAGPRLFVLLSREQPERLTYFRRLLRSSEAVQALTVQPLSYASMERALGPQLWQHPDLSQSVSRHLHALASHLFQRSEGNPLHLLGLLQSWREASQEGSPKLHAAVLPPSVRSTLLSESESWPEALSDAVSRLSAINGSFERSTVQQVLALDSETAADALLYDALERQILSEVETGTALRIPDFLPLRLVPDPGVQYMFRNEALRVVLAGQLPQAVRQEVRRRLVGAVADAEPGLASYYAERAGLSQQAAQLWARYQAELPAHSPLLALDSPERAVPEAVLPEVPAPPRLLPATSGPGRLRQEYRASGYTVSLDGGWLNVMSDGRYGHPQTLHLRFEWPWSLSGDDDLHMVWRLDVFGGGEELRPSQTPFPLSVRLLRGAGVQAGGQPRVGQGSEQGEARVYSPRIARSFSEGPLTYLAQPGVVVGQWMQHRIGGAALLGATALHLSVRALDVSLSIGGLWIGGCKLLPVEQGRAWPQPDQGGTLLGR